MTACFLVVLFKSDIYESKTVQSLISCTKYYDVVRLVIWDNSPNKLDSDDLRALENRGVSCSYIWTPENIPLSKIYNTVFSQCDDDLMFIFDQDTFYDEQYFDLMFTASMEYSFVNLFVPYIKVNSRIVSPGYFKVYKGKYFTHLSFGVNSSKNILAVSSGMMIRLKPNLGCIPRFDENLTFYGVDSKFCLDFSELNEFVYFVPYQLEHSLSQFEPESYTIKLRRFQNYKSSSLYILKQKGGFIYMLGKVIWFTKAVLFKLNFNIFRGKI